MFCRIYGMTGLTAMVSGWDFVLGGVILAVLLFVGLVVVPWIRRRYHPSNVGGLDGGSVFDIEGLERMRRAGLLTEEEFRSLRRAALGLDRKASKADNSTSSAPGGRDDEVSESHLAGPAQQPGAKEDEPDKEL
jgi:hypothetical protein